MSAANTAPQAVRAGVGLWCALAAFLLVQTAVSWAGRSALQQQLVANHAAAPEQAADRTLQLLLINTGIAVVFAAGYVVLGLLILTRRPWSRIGVSVLLAVQVVMMLGSQSLTVVNIIVLVLGGAAAWCCWSKTGTEWVTGEHE